MIEAIGLIVVCICVWFGPSEKVVAVGGYLAVIWGRRDKVMSDFKKYKKSIRDYHFRKLCKRVTNYLNSKCFTISQTSKFVNKNGDLFYIEYPIYAMLKSECTMEFLVNKSTEKLIVDSRYNDLCQPNDKNKYFVIGVKKYEKGTYDEKNISYPDEWDVLCNRFSQFKSFVLHGRKKESKFVLCQV